MEKAVIILSGGLDSTTLLYDIIHNGYDVTALSFDYGQKHKKELDVARKTTAKLNIPHKIIDLSIVGREIFITSALTNNQIEIPNGFYDEGNMRATVVPNRNMIMLSLAASYAFSINASHIYYGAHAGDHTIYPDCRREFIEAMGNVIEIADWNKATLEAPYLNLDKGDIVIKGLQLGVDYSLTWTCYKGGELACGKCGACQERLEAFDKAGIKDPIRYEQ